MKVRDLLSRLHAEGWYVARQKGSHRQLKHPERPGTVTVPGHPDDDFRPATLQSILKQAGYKP